MPNVHTKAEIQIIDQKIYSLLCSILLRRAWFEICFCGHWRKNILNAAHIFYIKIRNDTLLKLIYNEQYLWR